LELLKQVGDNFPKGYSTKDAWPLLYDEFFVYYCEKNNIEIAEEE